MTKRTFEKWLRFYGTACAELTWIGSRPTAEEAIKAKAHYTELKKIAKRKLLEATGLQPMKVR